ncbi:MAG TPA: hypothetical protein GXZ82_13670 [Firmicutes bacterium]|nr:hypothetical protein [Bacillota bacterium]
MSTATSDTQSTPQLIWYNPQDWGVEGKGWPDTESFYDRLPAKAHGMVRDIIWNLSRQSAGLCVHFITDAAAIYARWSLTMERISMVHMPGVSVSGLDLYAQDEQGNWRWVAIGKPTAVDNEVQLVGNLLPGRRMYRLYLPLYNGVRSLEIGVSTDAVFSPVKPRTEKPIVFYGSSIVQGGCASRPGTAHPALLGRRLNKPIINLGFSGNAHMEPELAQLLGELDPCVFVIDPLPNMQKPLVEERAEAFVRTIKERHPHTPLVLVEDRTLQNAWILPVARERHAGSRSAFKQAYTRLVAAGVTGLHYLEGAQLLSDDGEATVDGSHPTDEGFFRMADALEPVLRALL